MAESQEGCARVTGAVLGDASSEVPDVPTDETKPVVCFWFRLWFVGVWIRTCP